MITPKAIIRPDIATTITVTKVARERAFLVGEIAGDDHGADHLAGIIEKRPGHDADGGRVAPGDGEFRPARQLDQSRLLQTVEQRAVGGGVELQSAAALAEAAFVGGYELRIEEDREVRAAGRFGRLHQHFQADAHFDGADDPIAVEGGRDGAQAEALKADFQSLLRLAAAIGGSTIGRILDRSWPKSSGAQTRRKDLMSAV